jgi:multicomponent Na+:H+ antiporter subunit E
MSLSPSYQSDSREHAPPRWLLLRRGPWRAAAFAVLWWVLAAGDVGSWVIGVPVSLGAAAVSLSLAPHKLWRWRLIGMARFIPFFLRESLRGSIDVAIRALHPRLPLAPEVVHYRLRLPDDFARVFLANTVSLLPGSLSADLQHDRLSVHVLDRSLPVEATLRSLERRVAGLFGVDQADSTASVEPPRD